MPLQIRDSQYFQNFPDNALESRFSTKKEHFANIPSSHFYKVIRFSSLKCLREEGLKMKHFFPNFLWLLSMPLQTSLIAKEKKLQQQWAPKAISELLLPFAASLVAFPTELPPFKYIVSLVYFTNSQGLLDLDSDKITLLFLAFYCNVFTAFF